MVLLIYLGKIIFFIIVDYKLLIEHFNNGKYKIILFLLILEKSVR
jgi:hypothetical protein